MAKEYAVFYYGSKELLAITMADVLPGEITDTKALLAYEHGITAEDIKVEVESRTKSDSCIRKETNMSSKEEKKLLMQFAAKAQKETGRRSRAKYIPMARMSLLEMSSNGCITGLNDIEYVMVKDQKTGVEIQCRRNSEGTYSVNEYKTGLRYYAAYGSNINLKQMAHRCPYARVVGVGRLHDYRLTFRRGGYANIEPSVSESVPLLIWETTPVDERSLDRYEGYPEFYGKQLVTVNLEGGKPLEAYIYIMMQEHKGEYTAPRRNYYDGIVEGYAANGMRVSELRRARARTIEKIKAREI